MPIYYEENSQKPYQDIPPAAQSMRLDMHKTMIYPGLWIYSRIKKLLYLRENIKKRRIQPERKI